MANRRPRPSRCSFPLTPPTSNSSTSELARDEARRLRDEAAAETLVSLHQAAAEVYKEPLPSDSVERPLVRASVATSVGVDRLH